MGFCLLLTLALVDLSNSQYDSSYAFVEVSNNLDTIIKGRFCVNYEQWRLNNSQIATDVEAAKPVDFAWWSTLAGRTNVCDRDLSWDLSNSVVPLQYRLDSNSGSCAYPFIRSRQSWTKSFQFQVDKLIERGASVGLFLVIRGQKFIPNFRDYLFSSFSDPYLNHSNIPLYFVYNDTFFNQMLRIGKTKDLKFRFYRPLTPFFDISMLIILLLAVFCVVVGGYWSAIRREAIEKRKREESFLVFSSMNPSHIPDERQIEDGENPVNERRDEKDEESATTHMNCFSIAFLVVVVCAVLMLSYYFRSIMVFVFNALLVFAGTVAMNNCFSTLLSPIPCGHCRVCCSLNDATQSVFKHELLDYNWCSSRPMWRSVFILFGSLIIAITWFIYRNNAYSFIPLDLINICLCIHTIKGLRFHSLKWLVMLLMIMFIYDVFMVFGTPYLTNDGCSIMMQVATGIDCRIDKVKGYPISPSQAGFTEMLPLLLRLPRLSDPILNCFDPNVDMQFRPLILGLGDIILPGLLIGFCFCVDLSHKSILIYGSVSSIAYGLGLATTFVALTLMEMAQPALIYLIPFTLIPICLLALYRGEFLTLWNGDQKTADAAETTHGTVILD